jgi:hypothetical protein
MLLKLDGNKIIAEGIKKLINKNLCPALQKPKFK